eukprot:m.200955 g.200955  ORF g.200955 m.200955 type:complete len:155 (+) comp25953_c0_seq1:796-1260(+)
MEMILRFKMRLFRLRAWKSSPPLSPKVMRYIHSRGEEFNFTLMYSTPHTYITTINNLNLSWPVYEHDFYPCIFNEHYVRTGFYTSRPTEKGYDRYAQSLFRAATQLLTRAVSSGSPTSQNFAQVQSLSTAMSIHQHHDAMPASLRLDQQRYRHH